MGDSWIMFSILMYFTSISEFVKAVSMSGKMKSNRRQASELHFDFTVESLGKIFSSLI